MKYGERLRTARTQAGISQALLAEKVGITQSAVSQLENGDGAGSEFTAQIAHACKVNAYWLATGDGPMVVTYDTDHRTKHVLAVMEALPDEFRDEAVKNVDSLAELAERLKSKSA